MACRADFGQQIQVFLELLINIDNHHAFLQFSFIDSFVLGSGIVNQANIRELGLTCQVHSPREEARLAVIEHIMFAYSYFKRRYQGQKYAL
jgi:hypothetical protein